jgi:hypothetical protein
MRLFVYECYHNPREWDKTLFLFGQILGHPKVTQKNKHVYTQLFSLHLQHASLGKIVWGFIINQSFILISMASYPIMLKHAVLHIHGHVCKYCSS